MRCGYPALLLALLGCDPTSGLADTADAALPAVKRYFDGRGSRIADGPWNRVVVDVDADTLYHVGARRLDDTTPTFHLFGADVQEGCNVSPNAGTWLMGKPSGAPFRLLPYLEDIDERGRGTLRFTTLDCQVQALELPNAGRPYPRLYDSGYLVPNDSGYTFVDPWSGDTRPIATDLRAALVWNGPALLWDEGQLKAFSAQFEAGAVAGDDVVSVVPIAELFLMEDAVGLHRVSFDPSTLELTSTAVLAGACNLQSSATVSRDDEGAWVTLQLPCGNPRPSIVHLDEDFELVDEPIELPFEIDSRHTRALVSGLRNDEPMPMAALYLTDLDSDGYGTLWAWQAGAEESIKLGERAELDSVVLTSSTSEWDGVAQINYQALGSFNAYDWVHFRWNGETKLIAERIVRNSASGEVLVNFDGVAGDLPQFDESGVSVVAEDLPPHSSEVVSYLGRRHHARVDHFDGTSGRVVISTDPENPASWQELGSGVIPESVRFSWFVPAVVFLEAWDDESRTGSLVAYNYELDARATISEGVSSFDMTSYPWDGLIYAVPYGKQQGLWFSKAK